MGELWQQLIEFLGKPAIRLDDDVTFGQILKLVGIVVVSFIIAGFLRRWLRRLFNRLRIPENIQNRLLAILFLIVIIIGIGVGCNVAGISTGIIGTIFNYPLTELFLPPTEPSKTDTDQTETGEEPSSEAVDKDKGTIDHCKTFLRFCNRLWHVCSLKVCPMDPPTTSFTSISN